VPPLDEGRVPVTPILIALDVFPVRVPAVVLPKLVCKVSALPFLFK